MKLVLGTMTFGESVFAPNVDEFVEMFLDAGYEELDTAYVYNEGNCEKLLGEVLPKLRSPYKISTKVNPRITGKLDGEAAYIQLNESLKRLGVPVVDIFYLHFPDPATPVEKVVDVWHICHKNGWVLPTVFEGIYNPLTRKAETELNECLNHFGIRFYAYNPMAGGLLTGRYGRYEDAPMDGRFTHRPNYQKRYWKKSYFDAVEIIKLACEEEGITTIEATYRWLAYHSMLNVERGDAIIIGASKADHLKQNMETVKAGPLSDAVVDAFEKAWQHCKADCPEYFTLYKGKGSVGGEKK